MAHIPPIMKSETSILAKTCSTFRWLSDLSTSGMDPPQFNCFQSELGVIAWVARDLRLDREAQSTRLTATPRDLLTRVARRQTDGTLVRGDTRTSRPSPSPSIEKFGKGSSG